MECLNCQSTFEGNFCNICGQKASTESITLRSLFHNLPHSIFHVDKGIFKNILGIRNPKKTIFEYIHGKRVSYFNPFMMFIITTALVLYILNLFSLDRVLSIPVELSDGTTFNPGKEMGSYTKYIYLLAVFAYALPTYFLFKGQSRFNYAQQVIANLFILSWCNCIYLVLCFISELDTFPINSVMLASQVVLLTIVFRGQYWLLSFLKAIVAVLIQVVLYIVLLVLTALVFTGIRYSDKLF